jgi:hypothetical protein
MGQMSRHRVFWCAAALTGAVMLAVGFFSAFEIRLGASVGGGDAQETYDYVGSWSMVSYGTALSLVVLIAAGGVVGASLLGLSRRANTAALTILTVLALALSAITSSAGFLNDYDPHSAESCSSWSDCGGPFLNPGVQRLRREAAGKPEAKAKEYLFDPAYTARPFDPWKAIEFGSFILLCAAGFLLFRSIPLLLWAGLALGPLSAIAAGRWSSTIDCPVSTAQINEGNFALYPALFGLLSGVAALTLKRWKLGASILVITVLTGLYAFVIVAFTCENS